MSLCPTSSSTSSTPAGRLPTKADKEQKKNLMALSLLRGLGELFISKRIVLDNLIGINPKEYRLFSCTEFKNGVKVDKYVGYNLLTINEEIKSARQDFTTQSMISVKEAKVFARRLEKIMKNPDSFELIQHALTVIPAILAAENVSKISDSPFCLASIRDILNDEKVNFPDLFKDDGICVIQ